MTLNEARKISRIIGTADNGCSVCVNSLVDKLNEANLGFKFESTGKNFYIKDEYDDFKIVNGIYVKVSKIEGN